MMTNQDSPPPLSSPPRPLGLSFLALAGLALLAVPVVIARELLGLQEGQLVSWLLLLMPVAVWALIAVRTRVPRPFVTVLIIGLLAGAMIVLAYQVFWTVLFDADPVSAGSSLPTPVLRLIAVPGGLLTGTLMGVAGGLIAWTTLAVLRRRPNSAER